MTRKTKTLLAVGVGVLAVGGIGYLIYQQMNPASLPAGPVTVVTLGPGNTATPFNVSLAQRGTISIVAPTGGTLGTVTMTPTGLMVPPSSGANYEYVAAAAGTVNFTCTYTDSNNAAQTTTFTVIIA